MSLTISKSIAAAPADVFHHITDLRNAADRVDAILDIEVLTDGPVRQGTRFRETRMMFGKECTEEMEITQFDAPRSYTVEADSCGARMISRFDVKPEGDHSRVVMRIDSQPLTWTAKLLTPITKVLFSGIMRKCIEGDLDQIKSHVEQREASA